MVFTTLGNGQTKCIQRCSDKDAELEAFNVSNETITNGSHANKAIMGEWCFFTYRIYLVKGRDECHYNLKVLPIMSK